MRKILFGMGCLTWIVCNLAVIYGIGKGAVWLVNRESLGSFIGNLALGMVMLLLMVLLSLSTFALITMAFGSEEMKKRVEENMPDIF